MEQSLSYDEWKAYLESRKTANRPIAKLVTNSNSECYELYTVEPICDHDNDKAAQHIASIYDYDDAIKILSFWNSSLTV